MHILGKYTNQQRNTGTLLHMVAPQVCELGNSVLYWMLLVSKWKHCQLRGSLRRNLQVTCTFLFEAQCFWSARDPAGYQWPFSALLTGRLYSFLLPSKIQRNFKVYFWETGWFRHWIKCHPRIHHYNHLVAQLSFFLFQFCQSQSQLSAALHFLLPQDLSVLGCVRLRALLLDLRKRKTRTIKHQWLASDWKKMRSISSDTWIIVKYRLSWTR